MEKNCYSCEKPVQEDPAFKGKYACTNGRCVRFGLLSSVYLAPPELPEQTTPPPPDVPIPPDEGVGTPKE